MSNIADSSYHKFLTGETVDANGSPTGADLNPLFKIFQTAINDNYQRLIGLNSANISAPAISGIAGTTINNQLLSLWLIIQGLPWSYITGEPTTVDGYGITDASKKTHTHGISVSGDLSGFVLLEGEGSVNTLQIFLPNTVTPGTYTKIIVDAKGRVTSGGTLAVADIPTLTLSKISDAGTAASRNVGTASGNVPLVGANGLLDASIVPITSLATTYTVASQAAMLALPAIRGDLAVRTDVTKTFILSALPATSLSNWTELLAGASAVTSVAGKTGAVTLAPSDVGLGNVTNESKATMFNNSTFTGTSIGANWQGRLNGRLYTVSNNAPSTPSTYDLWFDNQNIMWKMWNGIAWDFASGGGGSVAWSAITGKPSTTAGFGITDSFIERGTSLPIANSGNRGREFVIDGTLGIQEVAQLVVTAGSTQNSNVFVVLDGVSKSIPVLTTDNTATLVATKIRATSFYGWLTGGSGTTVTFTSGVPGAYADATYSAGTTGATGTMTTTTQGIDGTVDEVYICIRRADMTFDWKQKEG